jgi:hypothetical protein
MVVCRLDVMKPNTTWKKTGQDQQKTREDERSLVIRIEITQSGTESVGRQQRKVQASEKQKSRTKETRSVKTEEPLENVENNTERA